MEEPVALNVEAGSASAESKNAQNKTKSDLNT